MEAQQTRRFVNSYTATVFGTTIKADLLNDHGMEVVVNKDGSFTLRAYGYFSTHAKTSFETRLKWLQEHAAEHQIKLTPVRGDWAYARKYVGQPAVCWEQPFTIEMAL